MKKILYIISAAMLALTACMQEKEQSLSPVQYPEGQVLVSVNVQLPEPDAATRAMGQVPTIESLYVAVFGSEGSFQNWIPATFDQIVNYQNHSTTAKYKVYLPITDKKRHIHFIANPPKDEHGDIIKPVFGDEDEVINAMVKTKGSTGEPEDAYWQKIELDHIGAADGNPSADGYYTPDSYTQSKLATVCLVRNYAKIKVGVPAVGEGETPPYIVKNYRLMNVPKSGSVAPWNTGKKEYEKTYMDILTYANAGAQNNGQFYEALMRSYLGYMPNANDLDTEMPTTYVEVTNNDSPGAYMYERTMFTRASREGTQTCFIAEVYFNQDIKVKDNVVITEGSTYWYKVAILGPDGEYIPILRNIQYSIEITGIVEAGYESAADAATGEFAGNISTGLAISSLNELSNGASTLRVNQTEFTSNGQKEVAIGKVPDYEIYWQFFPTFGTTGYTNPVTSIGDVAAGADTNYPEGYDVTITMYDITPESAINGSIDDFVEGTTTISGQTWGSLKIPIAERGDQIKTSVVRIIARYGNGRSMFREVIINVIPKENFQNKQPQSEDANIKGTYIEADELDGLEKEVKVHFKLPEGLGASLFPLNVTIEAKKNNLYSTSEDLPVSSGKSYWGGNTNSFYFIRQVTLSEYRSIENGAYVYNTDYVATLYTSKEGGNSTDIVLQDEKGFLNPCELSLTATGTMYANKYEETIGAYERNATFSVTSNINWTLKNMTAGLSADPSSFTASGTEATATTVTFTIASVNESETDSKVYEADLEGTLSNGHKVSKHFTITQQPRVKQTATATATFTYQNFSTTNLSATVDDITVGFTRIDGSTGYNGIQIARNQSSTITFTPVSSTEHMNVTITGITMSFNYNYFASSISGPFTGGTSNNNRNATYNGSNTTSPVSTTLTARNGNGGSRITSIVVNYTYEYYE